ncbi:MAG: GxGYxYP family putative glycoside hydrolase, partial [Oceanipulchritudo sp.]
MGNYTALYSILLLLLFGGTSFAQTGNHSQTSPLEGTWEVIPKLSPGVDRHSRRLSMEIEVNGDRVNLRKNWGRRGERSEDLDLVADGKARIFPVEGRFNLTTVYSALHVRAGDERTIAASLDEDGRKLVLDIEYPVDVAQGRAMLKETQVFRANTVEPMLDYTITRKSRPAESEETYTLKAAGSMEAYVVYLDDNWEVAGDLQRQAALIALQGLANRDGPNLYLVYPDTWQFNYSGRLMDWYEEERGYGFTELEGLAEALEIFRDKLDGYVIWDKAVRNSLNVAFTIAGLENAVPVTEEQIGLVEALGLEPVADLRGLFTGMTDAELYSWARDRYWDRCSRKHLIWMGGHSGRVMKPGVADWGVAQRVFFQDLSCRASDTEEFQMASELLADMDEDALIMGWHSYAKDRESEHVSLCSSFGLPVLGLHSNPNVSFENQIGFSEGFVFANNHNVEPDEVVVPENKVYLAAIQTDSIGIGAWLKPGRGEIPYAWEVTMNYSWLVPSLLEFFYSTATPNDHFVGALSGPGYMYPKSVPEEKLPGLIQRAN